MQAGRTTPLTRAEFEQAAASASVENAVYAEWRDTDGRPHRDGDLPTIITPRGRQEWCQHGKRHRDDDLPAIVGEDRSLIWYQYNEVHRDNDLPAKTFADGSQEWYQRGKLHRDDDLPAVERGDGAKSWRKHGKLHRDGNMPALIYVKGTPRYEDQRTPVEEDGEMEWWVSGEKTGDQNRPPPGAAFPGQLIKSASKW